MGSPRVANTLRQHVETLPRHAMESHNGVHRPNRLSTMFGSSFVTKHKEFGVLFLLQYFQPCVLKIFAADFGFARYVVDKETQKRQMSETYCGSAAYAAPEVNS